MLKDYKEVIIDAYLKEKENGTLSPNLINPTPGSIREECIIICRERPLATDNTALSMFFSDVEKGYHKTIENSRAVKFKQMPKILRNEIKNPGIKYIELLAWLLDFNPRPSSVYYKDLNEHLFKKNEPFIVNSPLNFENIKEKNKSDNEIAKPKKADKLAIKKHPIFPKKLYLILGLCLVVIFAVFVFFWNDNYNNQIINTDEKCMFWTGNHYEPIACTFETKELKTPLNIRKLTNFKKISTIDKLTKNDLGKVWYVKIDNKPEFFTDSGYHPIYTNKKLKPLTPYILSKYVSYPRYVLYRIVFGICMFLAFCTLTFLTILYKRTKKLNR